MMKKRLIKEKQEIIPQEYKSFLGEIKKKILSSQLKAATAINQELIKLYWKIEFFVSCLAPISWCLYLT